ncbi:MAG: hypothetical protein WCK15_24700, partial [Pirellula sp.]
MVPSYGIFVLPLAIILLRLSACRKEPKSKFKGLEHLILHSNASAWVNFSLAADYAPSIRG